MTDHFDEKAATWDDDPAHVERAELVARRIVEVLTPDRSTRVLEYGAGTGLLSQALRPHVGPIVLVDTSAGMRQVIRDKIDAGLLPDATVHDRDLVGEERPEGPFDLVSAVLALHHVEDLDAVLSAFAAVSAPGAHVAVVDLDEEDGSFHGDGFGGHHGFDRPAFVAALERAGFVDVRIEDCHHIVRDGVTYPMFLALGTRPA